MRVPVLRTESLAREDGSRDRHPRGIPCSTASSPRSSSPARRLLHRATTPNTPPTTSSSSSSSSSRRVEGHARLRRPLIVEPFARQREGAVARECREDGDRAVRGLEEQRVRVRRDRAGASGADARRSRSWKKVAFTPRVRRTTRRHERERRHEVTYRPRCKKGTTYPDHSDEVREIQRRDAHEERRGPAAAVVVVAVCRSSNDERPLEPDPLRACADRRRSA